VTVFGSIGRGEATEASDIDLALITKPGWDGRVDLEDHVRTRLGNRCDVLVFTAPEFRRLARSGEPVVTDIIRDGIVLVGRPPRVRGSV
jgi:predicted nucleotidyltransferase